MLEDVPGLINPIIQSMIATNRSQQETADRAQRAEQLKQQANEHKATLAIEQARQAQVEKYQEQEHQDRVDTLNKFHLPQLNAQLEMNKINRAAAIRDLIKNGVDPDKALAQIPHAGGLEQAPQPESSIQIPTILNQGAMQQSPQGQLPSAGMPTQADLLAQEARVTQAHAFANAQGTNLANEPFQINASERALTNAKDLQKYENVFKNQLEDKNIASREKIAQLERSTQQSIAGMTNATHLKVAGMQYTPTPESLQAMVMAGATGQAKLDMKNPQERAAYTTLIDNGFRIPDVKDIDALKQSQALVPLFKKLDDFSDKYLPSEDKSGSTVAKVKSYVQGKVAGTAFPTDIQNQINEIKAQAMNVGKTIEGLTGGRVTNTQLGLALDAITSPGITKEQAKDRLKNLQDLYVNKQQNVILGGMKPEQQDLIKKTYGIQEIGGAVKPGPNAEFGVGPNGHRIFTNDGRKTFYDAQTGQEIKQ